MEKKMTESLENSAKLKDVLDILAVPHPHNNDILVGDNNIQHDHSSSFNGDKQPEENDDVHRLEDLIAKSKPNTELEKSLFALLDRKNALIQRISGELDKLQAFVKKRKQVYKRKRKDAGHPVRPLSAYNIFMRERFEELKKENEKALKSEDVNAQMMRVPPSSLVQKTASEWKNMTNEMKESYEERARVDKKRYDQEMDNYDGPDKGASQKRVKTAYNIFFSSHVARLKESESRVPSERGSIARVVANAWKGLNSEEKKYYEEEAEKFNSGQVREEELELDHEEHDDEDKMHPHNMDHQYPYDMHHMGMPIQHPLGHDPRGHHPYYPPHQQHNPYPYNNYDYSQHQQRGHSQGRSGYYY